MSVVVALEVCLAVPIVREESSFESMHSTTEAIEQEIVPIVQAHHLLKDPNEQQTGGEHEIKITGDDVKL